MKRVTGIGGMFLKAQDPGAMYAWYERHLGIKAAPGEGGAFRWRELDDPQVEGLTAWAFFPEDTKYFAPSTAQAMINYRVEDLDALLEALRAEGVQIDPKREDHAYGRFAWVYDPEGNKIELWEPAKPGADRKMGCDCGCGRIEKQR